MFFVVSKDRLLKELEFNAKQKGKGVLNWFIKDINGNQVMNVIYSVYGCNYLYTCLLQDLSYDLKYVLQQSGEILGIVEGDYLSESDDSEEVEIIPEVTDNA
jgi:hypothetical protein